MNNEVVRCGFGPCGNLGVSPLSSNLNGSRCLSSTARTLFGLMVFIEPVSDGTVPRPITTIPPRRPWRPRQRPRLRPPTFKATAGNQTVWYTYAPQSYPAVYAPQTTQTTYAPQYYQPTYQPQTYQATVDTQVAPASYASYGAAPAAAATEGGDPYGFLGWLNSTRASYGLPAVGYDANLSNWAAMNNSQQAARGMGHFVMGPARRQNAAMGAFANIGSMWMNSPAHRAALLDPTITAIGIAGLGAYWTFNAY